MKSKLIIAGAALALITSCSNMENPLLTESTAPFGAPQFDKIKTEHYIPAFEAAIAEAKAEIDAIVADPDEPTFENTIEAMEYSGQTLNTVAGIFYNLMEAHTNDQMQAIAEEIAPKMTEFSMYVSLNEDLFKKVKAVYEKKDELGLDVDQMKLLEDNYKSFVRGGANLSDEDKALYSKWSEELSLATLAFGKNVLAATNAYTLHITDSTQLAGLPQYVRTMGAETAAEKGLEGWAFILSQHSDFPIRACSNINHTANRHNCLRLTHTLINHRVVGAELNINGRPGARDVEFTSNTGISISFKFILCILDGKLCVIQSVGALRCHCAAKIIFHVIAQSSIQSYQEVMAVGEPVVALEGLVLLHVEPPIVHVAATAQVHILDHIIGTQALDFVSSHLFGHDDLNSLVQIAVVNIGSECLCDKPDGHVSAVILSDCYGVHSHCLDRIVLGYLDVLLTNGNLDLGAILFNDGGLGSLIPGYVGAHCLCDKTYRDQSAVVVVSKRLCVGEFDQGVIDCNPQVDVLCGKRRNAHGYDHCDCQEHADNTLLHYNYISLFLSFAQCICRIISQTFHYLQYLYIRRKYLNDGIFTPKSLNSLRSFLCRCRVCNRF